METNTKEHIKNRMIKSAALLWNVPSNDIERSFDPLISLLMAACASEIEKISGEIDSSQSRITEKVIQMITPENVSGPGLAHGILYAEPIDNLIRIKPEYQFNYRKETVYDKTNVKYRNIHFSPVREFNLVGANIPYLATGTSFTDLLENGEGQPVRKLLKNSSLNASTLYLGIQSDQKKIPVQDVSVYFELKAVGQEELFYHSLRNAKWTAGDSQLQAIAGFDTEQNERSSQLKGLFKNVSEKTDISCQQVLRRYERNYVTLNSADTLDIEPSAAPELVRTLGDNEIAVDAGVRWVKIEFPSVVSNATLSKVTCSLNAIPVLNRQLISFSHQIREFINILPIKTDDLFFDIKSIVNTNGKSYRAKNKDNSDLEKGTFVRRDNNIAKLDKRKAREYIIHLLELLKEESASFAFLDNEFLRRNLNTLNQAIALLDKKVSEAKNDEMQTTYLALKPFESGEHLLVEYWTTKGAEANHIKSGSRLSLEKGFGIRLGTAKLLTTTHGGSDGLGFKGQLNSSRRALLSRDKIVTREDVKALCLELYGERIQQVKIKRGYTGSLDSRKGLVPCIEIVLTPTNQDFTDFETWETLESNLFYFLEKNSVNALPYKLILEGQDGPIVNGREAAYGSSALLETKLWEN